MVTSKSFDDVHNIAVRVSSADVAQTGFWVSKNTIVTCAHGFPDTADGDNLLVRCGDEEIAGLVIAVDHENDIVIIKADSAKPPGLISLSKDVLPGDQLYCWGFTHRYSAGESATVEMEGWSRDPYLLKVKAGMIEPGMSGAPVYSISKGGIVGMMRVSRDRDAPSGGRVIPSSIIIEACGLNEIIFTLPDDPGRVSEDDLPTIMGMFEAAYDTTRPRIPVDKRILESAYDQWPDGLEMLVALRQFERNNESRRAAATRWFEVNHDCLRFVIEETAEGPRRIGATSVLPMKQQSFQRYKPA